MDWRVYDPEGVWLGDVTLPLGILSPCVRGTDPCRPIHEIGGDYILMNHRDDLGVVRVKKYRLIKTDR